MIEYEEAFKLVIANVPVPQIMITPLEKAMGRILAKDIRSSIEMPPFNKSAMDGYALIARDTACLPVRLRCKGEIKAGEVFRSRIERGECVKIMTGSPLPKGTDSVVMVEKTNTSGDTVEVLTQLKKWENVCRKAEDIEIGKAVLKKGMHIGPSHVAVASTLGRKALPAFRKPTVALLSTGNEIIESGKKLISGSIYDANGPMLKILLEKEGIKCEFMGIAKDRIDSLKKKIEAGLKKDILLISGGVSMGDYDLVPHVLSRFGVKKVFHNANIKPGKPIFFGRLGKKLVFGIPGNPVSNLLAFYIFIKPVIDRFSGNTITKPCFLQGILGRDFRQKTGRCHFVLVRIKKRDNRFYLYPISSHGSADILASTKADGFMKVDGRYSFVKKGRLLDFISWATI